MKRAKRIERIQLKPGSVVRRRDGAPFLGGYPESTLALVARADEGMDYCLLAICSRGNASTWPWPLDELELVLSPDTVKP